MARSLIVYISIGNSDDKLTQAEWSKYYDMVDSHIMSRRVVTHGRWVSETTNAYQNACWCIEPSFGPNGLTDLKEVLASIAKEFNQDSIAWAEVKETEFIRGID